MASFKGSAAGMLSQGVTSRRDVIQLPCSGCKEAFSSFIEFGLTTVLNKSELHHTSHVVFLPIPKNEEIVSQPHKACRSSRPCDQSFPIGATIRSAETRRTVFPWLNATQSWHSWRTGAVAMAITITSVSLACIIILRWSLFICIISMEKYSSISFLLVHGANWDSHTAAWTVPCPHVSWSEACWRRLIRLHSTSYVVKQTCFDSTRRNVLQFGGNRVFVAIP